MAKTGNHAGIDKIETLVNANTDAADTVSFYQPGPRSRMMSDTLEIIKNGPEEIMGFAQGNTLFANTERVQEILMVMMMNSQSQAIDRVRDQIGQVCGDMPQRCFFLLYAHLRLNALKRRSS